MEKGGHCPSLFIFVVPARVPRDLSAVGKTPKKSRRRQFCLYFPKTIPCQGWSSPCSAPPGGTPILPFDFLVREIASRS